MQIETLGNFGQSGTKRKQSKHRIPYIFFVNGASVRHKKAIANAFNNYFASIGKEMVDSLPMVDGFEEHITPSNFEKTCT